MNAKWDSPWVGERVEEQQNGESNVDDLLDSLGLAEGASTNGEVQRSEGVRPSTLWMSLGALLSLGLVAALGAVLWQSASDSGGSDAAVETITTEADSAADIDAEAEMLRDVLGGLSLNQVDVEVRDGKMFLTGSVASEQDMTAIRNAVIASSDPALVNMNEIEVGGPAYADQAAPNPAAPPPPGQAGAPPAPGQAGALPPPPGGPPPGSPPPGFVAPTPQQQEALQVELNRVLEATPLVFNPGSTELNALQLKVLDTTIIDLLEGHPGVPVRLVGYTDDSGDPFQNSLLSIARAEAVQAYLISKGVPEFILRVEGRGEDDLSGDADADRRVEIEVIFTP